ncbi:hypothetical protein [Pyrococcus sp.]|uniref:hypothetical protein n=1 Tax=Pyrococcus sp. TaxID=33866 RepID=UPI0025849BCA|nr:hypothetical protein [Pyrococcus sp.]
MEKRTKTIEGIKIRSLGGEIVVSSFIIEKIPRYQRANDIPIKTFSTFISTKPNVVVGIDVIQESEISRADLRLLI